MTSWFQSILYSLFNNFCGFNNKYNDSLKILRLSLSVFRMDDYVMALSSIQLLPKSINAPVSYFCTEKIILIVK